MAAHLGADEAELGHMGFGVIFGVAAMAVVAGDSRVDIMHRVGERVDRFGQLSACR
jgi:hypothetical protein